VALKWWVARPFSGLGSLHDPSLREILLAVAPAGMHQVTWNGGVGTATGEDPYVVFSLDKPQLVYTVRLKFSYQENASDHAWWELYWRERGRDRFDERRCHGWPQPTGLGQATKTVCVNDTIDQIRFDPDGKPCAFQIAEITLVVPQD
jgi:hypothetical protein